MSDWSCVTRIRSVATCSFHRYPRLGVLPASWECGCTVICLQKEREREKRDMNGSPCHSERDQGRLGCWSWCNVWMNHLDARACLQHMPQPRRVLPTVTEVERQGSPLCRAMPRGHTHTHRHQTSLFNHIGAWLLPKPSDATDCCYLWSGLSLALRGRGPCWMIQNTPCISYQALNPLTSPCLLCRWASLFEIHSSNWATSSSLAMMRAVSMPPMEDEGPTRQQWFATLRPVSIVSSQTYCPYPGGLRAFSTLLLIKQPVKVTFWIDPVQFISRSVPVGLAVF